MSAPLMKRETFVANHHRVTFRGVVRSESIKLTSLRSNVGLLFAIIVFGLGVSVALGLTLEDAGLPYKGSADFMLDQVTVGTVLFGQLIAGILGVLVISGEYTSGTIQSTLIAVPARLTVLGAKAAVLFFATATSGFIALLGSWAATYPMLAKFDLEIGLTAPGVILAFIGGSVYLGLSAILGLGIGTLLRSVAAGVATVSSVILLLPIVLSVLPASQMVRNIHLLSMSKAGDAMTTLFDGSGAFLDLADGYVSAAAGFLVAVTWAGMVIVMGAIALRRKDA
jgi:ABC-2 type transport system permease protein